MSANMDVEIESGDSIELINGETFNSEPNEVDKPDYVEGEKVKDSLLDGDVSLKTQTSIRNCVTDGIYLNEINDNVLTENLSCKHEEIADCVEVFEKRSENGDIASHILADRDDVCENQVPKKTTTFMKKKRKKIFAALANDDIDYLREAAVSAGGLLSDDIRRKVWPKLLGVDVVESSPRPSREDIENHHYYRQVVLDVNRSLKRFPPSIKEAQRLAMLDQLVLLIMRVLCRHPDLHYYQGYHDICVTFLLVLGEDTAYYVVEKLSKTHLEVFMKESMEHTIDMLNCMYPLINKKCSQLSQFLLRSEVGVAYCISWLITWFGHVLNDYDTVVRLFDFFLVSDPVMPMYLTTAVVLHRKTEVLQTDCDMACVHALLSRIPDDLQFENLILESIELYKKYDYKKLKKEAACISENRPNARRNLSLVQSLARKIKSSVPASNFTVPLVIAAAVLVTAVLYQAYKY